MMKALSVKQPFAQYLVEGNKTLEIRSWQPSVNGKPFRGELVICASASPKNVFFRNEFEGETQYLLLPAGCIVGTVHVVDVRPMKKADKDLAMCDYDPAAFAWVCERGVLCRPNRVLGKLNLYDIEPDQVVKLKKSEWLWQFPSPQGDVKFSKACPVV